MYRLIKSEAYVKERARALFGNEESYARFKKEWDELRKDILNNLDGRIIIITCEDGRGWEKWQI